MEEFDFEKYLQDNSLVDYSDNGYPLLIASPVPTSQKAIKLFSSHHHDEAVIILCSLIKAWKKSCVNLESEFENLQFSLSSSDKEQWSPLWSLWLSCKDGSAYNGSFDWKLVVDVVDTLFPYMAGSNVSYLAQGMLLECY
jgi:hypothetical protein